VSILPQGISVCASRYSHRDMHAAAFAHLEPIVRQRSGDFSLSLPLALKSSL